MPNAVEAAELVTNFINLARKIACRWATAYPHLRSEFESEAVYTLWRTATEFDSSLGVKFATRLHTLVRWAMIRVVNRERAKNPTAFDPQFVPISKSDRHPTQVAPGKELPPDEVAELADDLANLPMLLDTLPADRREMVTQRYIEERGYAELAEERGTTPAHVRQAVSLAVKDLRKVTAR